LNPFSIRLKTKRYQEQQEDPFWMGGHFTVP
jgi:hypothetical protein